jgi:hypothetical protein
MNQNTGISFVFIGDDLPCYARESLNLAVEHSGLDVHLIGNSATQNQIKNKAVTFTAIEEFYDCTNFKKVEKNSLLSKSFRDGFWLKTLERFFVLEQFMTYSGDETIFHAELDQLLFRNDKLLENLNRLSKPGAYFPFVEAGKAVASLFYCNSHSALKSLVDFAANGQRFTNEMSLLAKWALENPEITSALPTFSSAVIKQSSDEHLGVSEIPVEAIGGIVDAADLGWWLAGNDPRNVSLLQLPKTKFVEPGVRGSFLRQQLSQTSFRYSELDGAVFLKCANQSELQVYNFHIHSKVHEWISRPEITVRKIFHLANQDGIALIPGTRRTQLRHHFSVQTNLLDRIIPAVKNPCSLVNKLFASSRIKKSYD